MENIQNKISVGVRGELFASEDAILWESIKKGNELAFSSLFKKFINPLYNYGMHFFPDTELVKDCIQELFTSIWQKKGSLSEVVQVRFYLFKSFRNLLFSKIAQNKRLVHSDFWDEECSDVDQSVESDWVHREEVDQNSKLLQQAIQCLTRRQREAVILRFYNCLESREVAEMMGISVAGVHNLVSKAIQFLRSQLDK